jgi:osmotically-inducible protein OsmY
MRSRFTKKIQQSSELTWLRVLSKPLIALGLFLSTLLFASLPSSKATNNPVWQPAPTQAVDPAMQDMELSLRARQAFAEDPLLSRQEIGIDVRNRVATLWGSVPSAEVYRLAEKRLRLVLGLVDFRNDLHVESEDRPASDRLLAQQSRSPLAEPMNREAPAAQQSVARRPDEQSLIASQEALWRPAAPRPTAPMANDEARAAKTPSAKSLERTPMPLVSLPGYPAHDSPPAPPAVSPKPAESNGGALSKAVEALRLSDTRFHRLQPEVRGGVVYLRGNVFRWDHVYELARSISNLPGVERVVLEKVHADSE